MSILKQINETVTATMLEDQTILTNLALLEADSELLTEAITHWLAKLRSLLAKGPLDPQQKQGAAYVLAAVDALSDPDIAAAFDEKEDLGTVLYAASGNDPANSQAAIQRLIQIGRHPSSRKYLEQAQQVLDNPQEATQFASQLQMKIDRIMQQKLAKEKTSSTAKTEPKLGLKNTNFS